MDTSTVMTLHVVPRRGLQKSLGLGLELYSQVAQNNRDHIPQLLPFPCVCM